MIAPLLAARLVERAYQVTGEVPDLSDLGLVASDLLYGVDLNGIKPYGFLAVPLDGSYGQVIVCRGTVDTSEWFQDGEVCLRPNPAGPGRVHSGFSALAGSFGWGPGLTPLMDKISSAGALSLLGHSLGAAAMRLLSMRLGHVALVWTWGEPKSGDDTASTFGISCAGQHRRAVNERDFVPMVPEFVPFAFPYVHAVSETTVGNTGKDPISAHAVDTYIQLETGLAA